MHTRTLNSYFVQKKGPIIGKRYDLNDFAYFDLNAKNTLIIGKVGSGISFLEKKIYDIYNENNHKNIIVL